MGRGDLGPVRSCQGIQPSCPPLSPPALPAIAGAPRGPGERRQGSARGTEQAREGHGGGGRMAGRQCEVRPPHSHPVQDSSVSTTS